MNPVTGFVVFSQGRCRMSTFAEQRSRSLYGERLARVAALFNGCDKLSAQALSAPDYAIVPVTLEWAA